MIRLCLPLVFACSALLAQETASISINRFVPRDSQLVIQMSSPAQWRSQFATTRVVKLLQSSAMAPAMAMMEQAMEGAMSGLRSSGKLDAEVVEKFLADFQGQMTLGVHVDTEGLGAAIQNGKPVAMHGALAILADGKTDLSQLANTLSQAFEAAEPDKLRDLKVGDQLFRYIADSDVHVGMPTLVDGHLVMIFGNNLPKVADKLLAKDNRFEGGGAKSDSMFVHAEIGTAFKAMLEAAADAAEDDGLPFELSPLFESIGLHALDKLELRLGADGADATAEMQVSLKGSKIGLLGAYMVDQGTPKLLRHIPSNAENFGITAFDMGALYNSIKEVWQQMEDIVPMGFDEAMEELADFLKIRLKEDLLDHMGTEMLNVADAEAALAAAALAVGDDDDDDDGFMELGPLQMLDGSCLAFSLRNGPAFAESLEKMIRARGLHATRKSEEYQDHKIYKLNLLGMLEIEYAVTDSFAVVAIGKAEGSRRNLRAVLDTAKNSSDALPANVQKRIQSMPANWSGISATSMPVMLKSFYTGFAAASTMMMDLPFEIEMVGELVESLSADMKRLGLSTMVSTAHTSKRGITIRTRW